MSKLSVSYCSQLYVFHINSMCTTSTTHVALLYLPPERGPPLMVPSEGQPLGSVCLCAKALSQVPWVVDRMVQRLQGLRKAWRHFEDSLKMLD